MMVKLLCHLKIIVIIKVINNDYKYITYTRIIGMKNMIYKKYFNLIDNVKKQLPKKGKEIASL